MQPKKEKKKKEAVDSWRASFGPHFALVFDCNCNHHHQWLYFDAVYRTPKLTWCPPGGGGSAAQKNGAAAGPGKRWLGVGSRVGDGGARAVALALFAPLAVPFLILLG